MLLMLMIKIIKVIMNTELYEILYFLNFCETWLLKYLINKRSHNKIMYTHFCLAKTHCGALAHMPT